MILSLFLFSIVQEGQGLRRQTQLGYLRTFNIGVTVFVVVGQLANTLVPMAALSLFSKKGEITVARVFPAISFFSVLVELLIALPQLLRCVHFDSLENSLLSLPFSACAVTAASWGRIYTFLMASEAAPVSSDTHPLHTDPIRISNGSFERAKKDDSPSANENAEKPKAFIHDINISIKEMNCVSGKVNHFLFF